MFSITKVSLKPQRALFFLFILRTNKICCGIPSQPIKRCNRYLSYCNSCLLTKRVGTLVESATISSHNETKTTNVNLYCGKSCVSLTRQEPLDRSLVDLLYFMWLFTSWPAARADMRESSPARTEPAIMVARRLAFAPGVSKLAPLTPSRSKQADCEASWVPPPIVPTYLKKETRIRAALHTIQANCLDAHLSFQYYFRIIGRTRLYVAYMWTYVNLL